MTGKTSQEILMMALELSHLAYSMDIAPFLENGWQDVSFQVDEMLLTGFKNRKSCEQAASRARSRMERLDPVSQYLGFIRHREENNACKAVVLCRPSLEKTVIAIAFTGTTRRMFEWLGNLRLEEEEGFHAGFLHLTKRFEENAGKIEFPALAASVGKEKYTLQDILQQLRNGDGRYELLITGHSQGAALTQIYVYHLLQSGIPAQCVHGIGFASPSVAATRDIQLAAEYPVINVINADDAVARVGGQMHVGLCRVLPSSAAYRSACYGKRAESDVMRAALSLLHDVRSTEEALMMFMAFSDSLLALPGVESEEILSSVLRLYLPDVLSQRLTGYARRIVRAVQRRLNAKHEKIFGPVDAQKLQQLKAQWTAYLAAYGAKEGVETVFDALFRTHSLFEPKQVRAYQQLVEAHAEELVSCIWMQEDDPVWDMGYSERRKGRIRGAVYSRFRPLSTQRRRYGDDI